ncbi:MAG: 30S ribosomal protein S2 [Candidatus Omnitrophica bacterium]|nr:30S ribosomal protein S2 [Candidatus Omnitrophota bacterium]
MRNAEAGLSQEITIKQLLEAGVHFGHQTKRWNPKMAPYIFTDRNGVYIIDLEKTLTHLVTTCHYLHQIAEQGGSILFVGTKRQAQEAIRLAAERTEMPYVNQRWLGGMLTNFETIRKSVARLEEIEKMEQEGTYQFLTKKEVAALRTQREKLLKVLAGIRYMKRLPSVLFIVDPKQEEIAVREAKRLGIPVAAIIDTNCNPDVIDYPIPGNDDAIRSVKLICEFVADAVLEGRNRFKQLRADQEALEAQEEQERLVQSEVKTDPEGAEEIAEVIEEKVVEKLVERETPKPKAKKPKPHKEGKEI